MEIYAEDLLTSRLDSMEIPEEWRQGKIIALFKKGDKKLASNYRPVSLTCILCKVLESLVRDHIIHHMNVNGYFSEKQFGFMAGRSTSLQLLKVLDDWTRALDQGNSIVLTVYIWIS